MYGATEASARLTYLDPDYFELKMGSIGKPIPGVTLKLVGTNGGKIHPGEKGELVASGLNIMQGYWKNKEATAKVLDDDGYHTGDIAYQDKDGFYYVTGRKDNLIKSGGHRINPQEIEDGIMDTGLVVEAAVVGIPDTLLGLKLAAVVEPKEKGNHQRKVFYKNVPGNYQNINCQVQIIFVRSLPKKTSGKIDREKCLDLTRKN